MKRRVLLKTTPFHVKKKKKGKRNGVVLNDTVPLSSSPGHAAREERKMVSFGCFFLKKKRISSLSLDHTPHQPEAPRRWTTDRRHWPTTRRAPTRKTGSETSTAAPKWPTNCRSPCSPGATIKSPALGSINRPKNSEEKGGRREEKKETEREGGRRPERERTERRKKKERTEERTNQREEGTNKKGEESKYKKGQLETEEKN